MSVHILFVLSSLQVADNFNDKRFTISKMINVMVSSLDEIFVKKWSPFLLKGTGLFIESKTNLLYKLIYNGLEI